LKPLIAVLIALLPAPAAAPQSQATFSTTANVVVVNVSVLGRDGRPIENLTGKDFLVYEDGKPQQLQSCEFERLDTKPPAPQSSAPPALKSRPQPQAAPAQETSPDLHDHRLIVLFFDLSAMQPAEQVRAGKAALEFLNSKMTSSDLVSIMTFGSSLRVVQDFTGDRDLLASDLHRFFIGDSSELAGMAATGPDAEDQSGMFTADETEFNIFNTDRKLAALEDAARQLGRYPEKKALVYVSSGVEKTGVDNQSQLRATVNAAVRANVAFYPIDARGLTAMAPGGDATQGGAIGSKLYRGAGQQAVRDSFQNQQETLDSLAAGTGGKALLDSNDLTLGMAQVQKDIRSYYTLTYASDNPAEDGRYRRIEVRLAPRLSALKARLDYRPGYYAPIEFGKMNDADREAQLARALASDNPVTDLPIAVEVDYFRLAKDSYFVPISVKMPGSALSFHEKGEKAATELDFIAQVSDEHGRPASTVRDRIPLKLDQATAGQVGREQVEYDTGVTLTPGRYRLRLVARENGEGRMGTFEAPFTVPDLSSGSGLHLSSVVLSSESQPLDRISGVRNGRKALEENPLIAGNRKIVPNVTRTFRPGQNLFVYLEVYDPTELPNPAQNARVASVSADLAFYQGTQKVFETQPARSMRLDAKRHGVLPIDLSVPAANLKPGNYVCQVNVVDELGRKFAYSRISLVVLPPAGVSNADAAGDRAGAA